MTLLNNYIRKKLKDKIEFPFSLVFFDYKDRIFINVLTYELGKDGIVTVKLFDLIENKQEKIIQTDLCKIHDIKINVNGKLVNSFWKSSFSQFSSHEEAKKYTKNSMFDKKINSLKEQICWIGFCQNNIDDSLIVGNGMFSKGIKYAECKKTIKDDSIVKRKWYNLRKKLYISKRHTFSPEIFFEKTYTNITRADLLNTGLIKIKFY